MGKRHVTHNKRQNTWTLITAASATAASPRAGARRVCPPQRRPIAAAGSGRMPNEPGSSTWARSAVMRRTGIVGGQYGCLFAATLPRRSATKVRHGWLPTFAQPFAGGENLRREPRCGRLGRVVGQFDCNKTRDPRFGRKPICVRTLSMSGRARLTITSVPAAFRCE